MARLIAIELGAYAVKASVYRGQASPEHLEAEVSQRVPQDGTSLPTVADRLAALDLLLRDHPDLSDGSHLSALVWPGSWSSTRRMTLPFADDEQIAQTLPFAVEAEVPFDLEDMVMAWRGTGGPGQVLVTLAKRPQLEAAIDGLAERGLDPRRVYPDGDVLGAYATGDEVTAVVDVGHGHTTVAVARDGATLTHRAVDVAGRTFTRAVQRALDCTYSEARALLHGDADEVDDEEDLVARDALVDAEGLVFDLDDDDDQGEPTAPTMGDPREAALDSGAMPALETDSGPALVPAERTVPRLHIPEDGTLPVAAQRALDGALGLLLAEVRSSLVQAEDDLGLEITRVVLTGGAARAPRLAELLAADLDLPVDTATDEDGVTVPGPVALGRALALRISGEDDASCTDLRVDDLAYRGGLDTPRTIVSVAAIASVAFLSAVIALFAWQAYTLTTTQAELETQVLGMVRAVVEDVPEDVDGTTAVGVLGDLLFDAQLEADFVGDASSAPPTVHLLHRLTAAFPPHPDVKVDLDRVDITDKVVNIRGVTDDFPQVDQIGESLKQKGGFADVEAEPGTRDRKGRLEFSLVISRVDEADEGDTDIPLDEEG